MSVIVWTPEMDQTLLQLAAKYPRGTTRVFWSLVVKDRAWRWPKIKLHTVAVHARKLLARQRAAEGKAVAPIRPRRARANGAEPLAIKFCPSCGAHLLPYYAALGVEELITGGVSNGRD